MLRHAPEDFIVRFRRRDDLERVLHAPPPEGPSPFLLTWRRWTRLFSGDCGSVHVQGSSRHQGGACPCSERRGGPAAPWVVLCPGGACPDARGLSTKIGTHRRALRMMMASHDRCHGAAGAIPCDP